jgi:radical SAM protein with 4Fe4S-binding SPASM domain
MYEKRIVNRAGFLFDYESKNRNKPCLQPYGQAVINWEGDVLLCCNDYYAKYTFGNLKEISLLESWNNVRFKKYRKILLEKGGRQKIDLCRNCDR